MSTKNLPAVLNKIVDGVAPSTFTIEHMKNMGFSSSGDRAMVPLLKDLGFLDSNGVPLPRYHEYRDRSRSKAVMADAIRDAYGDIFHISERPTVSDRPAIEGLFKSKHNSTDKVAKVQAMTFYALLDQADLESSGGSVSIPSNVQRSSVPIVDEVTKSLSKESGGSISTELHYTIQIHLPATKDIEVFNAIFRSLRENLLA